MSKQNNKFVDAEYEEVRDGQKIGNDPVEISREGGNLFYKAADGLESLGNKFDDLRKARAAKKAAKQNMTDEERKAQRASKVRKVLLGVGVTALALGGAALGLKKLAGDGPLVAYDFTPEPVDPDLDDTDAPDVDEELYDTDIPAEDPADIEDDTI